MNIINSCLKSVKLKTRLYFQDRDWQFSSVFVFNFQPVFTNVSFLHPPQLKFLKCGVVGVLGVMRGVKGKNLFCLKVGEP